MSFRIPLLALLCTLGFLCCDAILSKSSLGKKNKNSIIELETNRFKLLNEPNAEPRHEENEKTIEKQQSSLFQSSNQSKSSGKTQLPLFKNDDQSNLVNNERSQKYNNQKKKFKKIKPTLNLQQRRFEIFHDKNKSSDVGNEKKSSLQGINASSTKSSLLYASPLLEVAEKGTQVNDCSYLDDIRFEILEHEDLRERDAKRIECENEFRKEKMKEMEEHDFSIVEPEEDQIETWDDTEIYKQVDSGEERMMKFPHEIGNPKKIAIRNHPELKGFRQSDIDLSEMKSRQLELDQELEFIETSQEAQHMFETAGSPFRSVKKGIKDPLYDEDMVALDMPLGYTPDGIRDIVEEYFWGDFPSFNYEQDRVNPPENLAHFFEVAPKTNNLLDIVPLHRSVLFEPEYKDNISIYPSQSKDVKVIIAERRDLLTVKDRPFSLTRSISKGFKNIFMRRKSKKAKQKFLIDLRDAIIEWSNEYDKEFPMITLSPNKYISPKVIKESLIDGENKDISLELNQRLEFMEEMLKKYDVPVPEDSTVFNIHLSKILFPELKFEDIPEIKGVPVEELIILSSPGILPGMGDFEYTLNSLRNELLEAERLKASFEDPLDSRKTKRHVLLRDLPPISASDDELALWEMEQREKMLQEEYDEHGHRKFKLQLLPLDRSSDLPDLKIKSPEKKIGKVEVSDEEVQNLRKYEKSIYPEYIKRTDKLAREVSFISLNRLFPLLINFRLK